MEPERIAQSMSFNTLHSAKYEPYVSHLIGGWHGHGRSPTVYH